MSTEEILKNAVAAKPALAVLSEERKNEALRKMAEAVLNDTAEILKANAEDLEAARGSISDVMLDRLALDEKRIQGMADGILDLVALPDPVGRILEERTIAGGMRLQKVSVPMGVVAIIYESRPNVTSDAAALCLKSGNVCVLRGGKEAFRSSRAIVQAMRKGLAACGLPESFVNIVEDTSRDSATALMKAHGLVDLLIPRGGAGLIRACVENATVPCIETGTGICSIYVDETADLDAAVRIIVNAKTQRPSVCNAEEQLLVQKGIAGKLLPMVKKAMVDDRISEGLIPVELRLSEEAMKYTDGTPAGPGDFDTEFLDYVLAVRLVSGVEEAVEHIRLHSTHHSEAILSRDSDAITYFTKNIDSAALYVNASTRFTDGGMYGLGCEMGISTQKLHARGPMGLQELTSYKYIVTGNGNVR